MTATMQAPRKSNRNDLYRPEDADVMARVARIKRNWSAEERQSRAESGRHRRAILATLVESAVAEPALAEVYAEVY